MTSDSRDILRLKRRPRCGYDLATLPRKHRCPEGGFEYDESMFAVPVWRHGDRPNPWMVLMMAFLILMCVPAAVAALLFPVASVYRTLFWLVIAVGSVFGLLHEVRKYLLKFKARTNSLLLAESRGIALRWDGRWKARREWPKLSAFKFRRTWNRKWRLRLKHKWWHPLLGWDINVVLDGTWREAALLRNEIRRRIQAARNG